MGRMSGVGASLSKVVSARTLGVLLRDGRRQAGLSQRQAARQLLDDHGIDITPQAISRWECDLGLPALDTLLSYGEVLGLKYQSLCRSIMRDAQARRRARTA